MVGALDGVASFGNSRMPLAYGLLLGLYNLSNGARCGVDESSQVNHRVRGLSYSILSSFVELTAGCGQAQFRSCDQREGASPRGLAGEHATHERVVVSQSLYQECKRIGQLKGFKVGVDR